jgi:S1-C subfamily serine protease
MILTASGEILTNNHVIDGATSIKVTVPSTGRSFDGEVVGYDITDDVAVVQLRGASGLTPITPAKSPVSIGQRVVAIGNALGQGGTPAAEAGVVSATNQDVTPSDNGGTGRTLHGLIQVNAQIVPGDSGGALVNASAQVVGMNTAASVSNGFRQAGDTVGFAIPIDTALSIAHQIESGQQSGNVHIGSRGMLGVSVRPATARGTSGVGVIGVQGGSPAASAGIGAGDTIVALNGTSVASPNDLTDALFPFHAGDTVSVTWIDSGGRQHSATVTLIAGPPA